MIVDAKDASSRCYVIIGVLVKMINCLVGDDRSGTQI